MSQLRMNVLRKKMQQENLDGLIITHPDHIRYICGFTGDAGVLAITRTAAFFLTDSRFTYQARQQVKAAKISQAVGEALGGLKDVAPLHGKNLKFGFAGDYLTVSARERLQKTLPDAILLSADTLLADMGWVKDSVELANIKKACGISDTAFGRILNLVRPGVRESELAAELEYQMLMLGSQKPAFETIVASGYRSAMPHGVASPKKVENGDFITFDFGATFNGYVSDITRTVVVGKANARQKKIYDIVLRAQLAGIKKVKAGVPGKDVDAACRTLITKAGFGKHFGHGTGHGIGYYVHVGPRVSSLSKDTLQVNNVVTIEPGIYLDGWGGVRIEDDVVVTRTGGQVLNRAEKKLLEL